MELELLIPQRSLYQGQIIKLRAEGPQGWFGLLPHHVDTASPVLPGFMGWQDTQDGLWYAAVDRGCLIKQGARVTVAVHRATVERDLGRLQEIMTQMLQAQGAAEQDMRTALQTLETDLARRLVKVESLHHGS
jgi:F-type H+-transporting ATPase subunit epsilon